MLMRWQRCEAESGPWLCPVPQVVAPFVWVLPVVMWLLRLVRPGLGAPAYIPSSLLRYITFKLTLDLQQIPALDELTRCALGVRGRRPEMSGVGCPS